VRGGEEEDDDMTARITEPAPQPGPGDHGPPAATRRARAPIAPLVFSLLGEPADVAVKAFDGSRAGPDDPAATLDFRSPAAFTRLVGAPGELGFARAIVAGDLVIDGDLLAALELRHHLNAGRGTREMVASLVRLARAAGAPIRRLPPPPEEVKVKGRLHSRSRDKTAVSHHYDVGNDFYRLFLGPTMTYSCAVWADPTTGLDAAQEAKHALVAGKLGLRPGMRVLDVGCGWGGMLLHAATHHGVTGVGITLSQEQAALARKRIAEAGLSDKLEVRVQDYRDVDDGPFDAISSIGMVEHVGAGQLDEYTRCLYGLLVPGGRLLNHGIAVPHGVSGTLNRKSFLHRYIFPDGEMEEVSTVMASLQRAGFEVRHSENLREHYALTLRAWLRNLEDNWDEAVRIVGVNRARVWRLYLAGCVVPFEIHKLQVHQVLASRVEAGGRSHMPLRPDWTG
jgi:cyclopropane-fatty-acyl-phospholipid synthase